VHDPWTVEQYNKVSAVPITSDSPAEFAKFMRQQVAFWGKITKDLDIKVE
jgi:tripartite-type tricarboxylate transporter receptor subunit TctC